jgi:hypothetical protein
MTVSQILETLRVCSAELEALNADPNFRDIQDSENFTTPNDLTLTDAIQAIYEVEGTVQQLSALQAYKG